MTIESISAVTAATGATGAGGAGGPAPYGARLAAEGEAFGASLENARTRIGGVGETDGTMMKAAFQPLDQLNTEAKSLGAYAETAAASENTLSPGELVDLTVRSQKFMFHSQLTSNVANRMADGVQQLFRQQG